MKKKLPFFDQDVTDSDIYLFLFSFRLNTGRDIRQGILLAQLF